MCEPTTATLAIASIAATALGTGVSMYGQMQQSKAQAGMAEYQSAVARNNSILAERAAADAELRGAQAERRQRSQISTVQGRQRAVLAANGVLVDDGSALDLVSDTAQIGEVDALTIRSNAQREAMGYRAQGANYQADASLASMRASAADPTLGMAGTFLGGLGSVASKWYSFRKNDVFNSGGGFAMGSYGAP